MDLTKIQKIKKNTIYTWDNGEASCHAVAVVQFGNKFEFFGMESLFEAPHWTNDLGEEAIKERSRRNAINRCQNLLNVLRLYGMSVVDKTGNIDGEKVREFEAALAKKSTDEEWKRGKYAIKQFPVKRIYRVEAELMGLL
jgi:hypothetical protein